MTQVVDFSRNKVAAYLFEIGKWALVIWLLLPIREAASSSVDLGRVVLGVVLFLVFAGKMLYDVVYFRKLRQASAGKDFLSMMGIVLVVALLVSVLVVFVAFYAMSYLRSMQF